MCEELNALIQNRTCDLVPSQTNQNIIGYNWLFQAKRLPYGSTDSYKVRLVAKDFNQHPGVDYLYIIAVNWCQLRRRINKNWHWCSVRIITDSRDKCHIMVKEFLELQVSMKNPMLWSSYRGMRNSSFRCLTLRRRVDAGESPTYALFWCHSHDDSVAGI